VIVSQQALQAVIGRAILDAKFRFALYADPATALVEYELTGDEMAALQAVDAESLEACAIGLSRHILSGRGRTALGPAQ
jgi:hypothetical protein